MNQRVEAFKVRLDGDANEMFDVMYKAHVQDVDWMNWVRNGEVAGTTGEALRLEAFKAMVVPKGYDDSATYREYTPEQYTVNFDSMDGECSVASKPVSYCGFYNNLPIPTKAGCVFAGWYDSPEYTNKITTLICPPIIICTIILVIYIPNWCRVIAPAIGKATHN